MFNLRRVTEITFGTELQTFQKHGVIHRGNPGEDQEDSDSLLHCLSLVLHKKMQDFLV